MAREETIVQKNVKDCKTRVLSELEKVCVNERAFVAARKSIHDAFDVLLEDLGGNKSVDRRTDRPY